MCGRYSFALEQAQIEERFQATFAEPYTPRYNAAPSQNLPVILNTNPQKIIYSHWGLHPAWMKNTPNRGGLINVRMETLRDRRTFLQDLKIRRCLIPADGFYEWKVLRRGKGPYRILRTDGSPMAFAGIWEEGAEGVNAASRFAVVTTEANAFMRPIHSRMPVILNPEEERRWLDAKTSLVDLISILKRPPRQKLRAYAVSKAVNKASVDTPELIEPLTRSAALFE